LILKTKLQEWTNLELSGVGKKHLQPGGEHLKSRTAKYLVIPPNREVIKNEILPTIPGEIEYREAIGAAEDYRVEIRDGESRLTITQYDSGTLMIQGVSSLLFDNTCEVLDQHLAQAFSERAARFIPGDQERQAASAYLDLPESENEAVKWLREQMAKRRQTGKA